MLAQVFSHILDNFGISNKILVITGNNASNNDTMINELEEIIPEFNGLAAHACCFLHITNLVVKCLINQFDVSHFNQDEVCYKMISNHTDYQITSQEDKSLTKTQKNITKIFITEWHYIQPFRIFETNILTIYANVYSRIHDPKNHPQVPEIKTAHMHHQKPAFSYNSFSLLFFHHQKEQ